MYCNSPRTAAAIYSDRVFLIPQTLPKFHPHLDDVIQGIISKSPHNVAVIIFNRDKYIWKARLASRLGHHPQIKFVPSVPKGDFLKIIDMSDVLIDPFPFGGGVTTLEALGLCKPVVTFPGRQANVPHLTAGIIRRMENEFLNHMLVLEEEEEEEEEMGVENFVEMCDTIAASGRLKKRMKRELCGSNKVLYENMEVVREWEAMLTNVMKTTII